MPKFRVLRVLEYTYDTVERMLHDQDLWQVQGTKKFGEFLTIRSSVVTTEIEEN